MISPYWFIGDKADFYTSRSARIGASDVPAIFPNPENPVESLAGYGRTALTVYQEKRGDKERDTAGLAAEMGHFLENKSLELFIRRFVSYGAGLDFRTTKEQWEFQVAAGFSKDKWAGNFQVPLFKHNTQYYTDGMIAHPDCLYIGDESLKGKKERFKTVDGVKVDLSKPFLIEAKSARMMAAKRPEGSFVKGYDKKLSTWQGIPLKHYFQIQYQLSLFKIDVAYLALIHDTSEFHVWRIDADRKIQGRIIDRVGRMVKHIKDGTLPSELAMDGNDVQIMYPDLKKDYITFSAESEEGKQALKVNQEAIHAKHQKELWTAREKDAKDAAAVIMKDFEEVRVGGDSVFKWSNGSTGEKLSLSIAQLKKNHPARYRSMVKAGLIKPDKKYRYVSPKRIKGEE